MWVKSHTPVRLQGLKAKPSATDALQDVWLQGIRGNVVNAYVCLQGSQDAAVSQGRFAGCVVAGQQHRAKSGQAP